MTETTAKRLPPIFTPDRPIPQAVDAENAVLSCLLLDPAETLDTVFSKLPEEDCFYNPANRAIYRCLRLMRNEMLPGKIDMITITAKLEQTGTLADVGGMEYLSHLQNVVPTTANLDSYLTYVIDAYKLRRLINECTDIIGRCYEEQGRVSELIDHVEQKILEITAVGVDTEITCIRDIIKDSVNYLNDLEKGKASTLGLPTGFDIDKKITGMKAGELLVLAARPSIGKTALALDIVRTVAMPLNRADGKPVGVFSLEMGRHQIALRLLCGEAKINIKDVRDGNISNTQWSTVILPTADRLSSAPIYIDDTPQLSTIELRQKSRRMKIEYGIQLIVIDYLQLMRSTGVNRNASREQEVSKLSADIKSLAKELNIPILLLCQLNRQAEQGDMPKLSHLRESGAIEQDADIVMLLHRKRAMDAEQSYDAEEGIESKLLIAKNRNGETGIVNLTFRPEWTRFFNSAYIRDHDVPMEAMS